MPKPLPDPLQRNKANTTMAMRERFIKKLTDKRDHWVRPLTMESAEIVSAERHEELLRLALCAADLSQGRLSVAEYEAENYLVSDRIVIGDDTVVSRKLDKTSGNYRWIGEERSPEGKLYNRRFPNTTACVDFAVCRMAQEIPEESQIEFLTLMASFADGPLFGNVDEGLGFVAQKKADLWPELNTQMLRNCGEQDFGELSAKNEKEHGDSYEPF